jgi:hypothetical protein
MTSKDKTGDKLVASIRKSKSGTVASKTSQRPDADESAAKPKAATAKSSTAATSKSARAETDQGRKNTFIHGRRVWPD